MTLTDKQAEEIVLLSRFADIPYATAAVALGYIAPMSARAPGQLDTWESTVRVFQAAKKLDIENQSGP